jgi:hypothetical protein
VARTHARLWAQLAAGTPVGAHDLLIAATALAHGYAVLTDDPRDFGRVPGLVKGEARGTGVSPRVREGRPSPGVRVAKTPASADVIRVTGLAAGARVLTARCPIAAAPDRRCAETT